MKLYIGIDPGKSGAIAFIPESGDPWAVKMPDTEKDLFDCLDVGPDYEPSAYIEQVSSSPQMGVVSAFTFGRSYGSLRMALIGQGIRFQEVTPGKWQQALKCRSGGDKNVTKARAQQLFPSLKIFHYNADALLIAEYGRLFHR